MEFDEHQAQTPSSGKKKRVSKAASNVKKMITRRLSKSISSERGGSISSSENVPTETPSTNRLGALTRRLRRSRNKSDIDGRGAVTERAPRRSFSVDDMTNMADGPARRDETDSPVVPIEKEVKVPDFGESEQFVQPIFAPPNLEVVSPARPETPVHEQRQISRAVDARSSSSANVSGNDDMPDVEPKEAASFEDSSDRVHDAIMHAKESDIEEKVKEIDALRDSSFEYPPDAHATIDAQIERTVMESLVANETVAKETLPDDRNEIMPTREAEPEDEEKKVIELVDEKAKIEIKEAESTEVIEAVVTEKTDKDAVGGFVEEEEDISIAHVKTRDVDVTDLIDREGEQDVAVPEAEETADPKESNIKPKHKRKIRIFRRASISLAYLAVGLLIVIIKNKH